MRCFEDIRAIYRSEGPIGRTVMVAMLVSAVIYGGSKPGLRSLPPPNEEVTIANAQFTVAERTLGLACVTNTVAIAGLGFRDSGLANFEATSNAVAQASWLATGVYDDYFTLTPSEDAPIRIGTNEVRRLMVFSHGFVKAMLESGAIISIEPFHVPMSFIAQGKWAECGVTSRCWTASSPASTIIAWDNALLNRDPAQPLSFQMEFLAGGDIVCRYGDSAAIHSRTNATISLGGLSITGAIVRASSLHFANMAAYGDGTGDAESGESHTFGAECVGAVSNVVDDWRWSCAAPDVSIMSPSSQTTAIVWNWTNANENVTWETRSVMVSCRIGDWAATNSVTLHRGSHMEPQTTFSLLLPPAFFATGGADVVVSYNADIPKSGTITVTVADGAEILEEGPPWRWTLSAEDRSLSATRRISATGPSRTAGDIALEAVLDFENDDEDDMTNTVATTAVELREVAIPSAPDSGLVVLAGSSVPMSAVCEPTNAVLDSASCDWFLGRRRGDASYDEWRMVADDEQGKTRSTGGIRGSWMGLKVVFRNMAGFAGTNAFYGIMDFIVNDAATNAVSRGVVVDSLMAPRTPLWMFTADHYDIPAISNLLEKVIQVFSNEPEERDHYRSVLSGEYKRHLDDMREDGAIEY